MCRLTCHPWSPTSPAGVGELKLRIGLSPGPSSPPQCLGAQDLPMCHPTGNLFFTRTLWLKASLSPPSSQNKPQSFSSTLWVDAQKSWVAAPKQVCDRSARHLLECNALLWMRPWWQANQCGLHWSASQGSATGRLLTSFYFWMGPTH